jgi:hypothetical protein
LYCPWKLSRKDLHAPEAEEKRKTNRKEREAALCQLTSVWGSIANSHDNKKHGLLSLWWSSFNVISYSNIIGKCVKFNKNFTTKSLF